MMLRTCVVQEAIFFFLENVFTYLYRVGVVGHVDTIAITTKVQRPTALTAGDRRHPLVEENVRPAR